MQGKITKSGVREADDFRDNLVIDKYDPIFTGMRSKKTDHMRSENSEDVLTWNTFRSLQQIDPNYWFPILFKKTFHKDSPIQDPRKVHIKLWPRRVSPPPSLPIRESGSEIDVVMESDDMVWFIEAKYKSDISLCTTHDPNRNQVLRNIDVGSWYAGEKGKDFYFSLLVKEDESSSKVGVDLVEKYSNSRDDLLSSLPHRTDMLEQLKGLGVLTWLQIADLLSAYPSSISSENERFVARHASDWLRMKCVP
jgi:hypothetical protein